jgi:peptidoglycan/LPS O-acetylase OafA/YrhL
MFFLALFTLTQMTGAFAPGGGLHSVPLNFWADPIIFNFIFGMGFAVLYKQGIRFSTPESLMLIGLSLATSVVAYQYNDALNAYPENHFFSRMASAIPPMFLFVAAAMGPQVDVGRTLWKVGLLIGDASYSLYLIHPFLLRASSKLWIRLVGAHLPAWEFLVACPFIALAGGLCCYYLAERPFIALFSNTRTRMSAAPVMSPGV